MTSKLTILTHEVCQQHDMGEGHPESPARLKALDEIIRQYDIVTAQPATREQILLAHDYAYIDYLEAMVPDQGTRVMDADTILCPQTYDAALHAAGAACKGVDIVMTGKDARVFCATRPPGHHAEPDKACGFCFFCNPFIAARYAQERHGVGRVAIIDFDVHHGNGTAACMRDQGRDDIFYVSTHQWPLFPGTGYPQLEDDMGGLILDVPLQEGVSGKFVLDVYKKTIFPKVIDFQPELIVISAGFDAHIRDPLAGINLETDDFAQITQGIVDIADEFAKGRILSLLEGGYNLQALQESVAAHLKILSA